MFKWTFNYETGDYEYMNRNGYSMDTGDFSFNFDKTPFENEDNNNGLFGGLFGGLFEDEE